MAKPAISLVHEAAAPGTAAPRPEHRTSPENDLLRLAALHREAEETARLANLLGRGPQVAAMLAIAAGLVAGLSFMSAETTALAAWLVLVLVGVGALARSYSLAIHAPFERAPLIAFSLDLQAILTYCGFAWGAGAFLVLPDTTGPLAAFAFAAGPSVLLAALLRANTTVIGFLVPATVLAPLAMVIRPLPEGPAGALLTIVTAGLIAGVVLWHQARTRRDESHPPLASLLFG